jgi:hypothetical protein
MLLCCLCFGAAGRSCSESRNASAAISLSRAVKISRRSAIESEPAKVIDLGCSYGVNGALLKYGRSTDELYRLYGAGAVDLYAQPAADRAISYAVDAIVLGSDRLGDRTELPAGTGTVVRDLFRCCLPLQLTIGLTIGGAGGPTNILVGSRLCWPRQNLAACKSGHISA